VYDNERILSSSEHHLKLSKRNSDIIRHAIIRYKNIISMKDKINDKVVTIAGNGVSLLPFDRYTIAGNGISLLPFGR
jgi:hypothetical protein